MKDFATFDSDTRHKLQQWNIPLSVVIKVIPMSVFQINAMTPEIF